VTTPATADAPAAQIDLAASSGVSLVPAAHDLRGYVRGVATWREASGGRAERLPSKVRCNLRARVASGGLTEADDQNL